MATLLVLVSLLILMMMTMMRSDEIITACSGEAVLLPADLQEGGLSHARDIRWTHSSLVVSRKNSTPCKKRCELLKNGSLRFNRVATADSGNYSLEVFDEKGKLLNISTFLLRVEADSSSSTVLVSVLMCIFLLMLFFIIFFILMRRRNQRARTTTGPLQENVYVVMHGNHGNKKKDKEEEKEEREEECHYVACNSGVSMEAPITQQRSAAVEDIYM